eukprot:COSAG04_NODE_3842_length_2482_cov_1.516995_1_plen_73_part_00
MKNIRPARKTRNSKRRRPRHDEPVLKRTSGLNLSRNDDILSAICGGKGKGIGGRKSVGRRGAIKRAGAGAEK